jgi:hypothetical protein
MSEYYMSNENTYKRLSVKEGVVWGHPRKGRAHAYARAEDDGSISPRTWDCFCNRKLQYANEISQQGLELNGVKISKKVWFAIP